MTGKELFEAMGAIDERFIAEAETASFPGKTIPIRWLALAACLCLILLGLRQPAVTEGAPETTVPCGVTAGDGFKPESIEEVPSVLLTVEELTDNGFRGTVSGLVDTDLFEIGTELNVLVTPNADREAVHPGSAVLVQFISYEEATQTITVDQILKPKG